MGRGTVVQLRRGGAACTLKWKKNWLLVGKLLQNFSIWNLNRILQKAAMYPGYIFVNWIKRGYSFNEKYSKIHTPIYYFVYSFNEKYSNFAIPILSRRVYSFVKCCIFVIILCIFVLYCQASQRGISSRNLPSIRYSLFSMSKQKKYQTFFCKILQNHSSKAIFDVDFKYLCFTGVRQMVSKLWAHWRDSRMRG